MDGIDTRGDHKGGPRSGSGPVSKFGGRELGVGGTGVQALEGSHTVLEGRLLGEGAGQRRLQPCDPVGRLCTRNAGGGKGGHMLVDRSELIKKNVWGFGVKKISLCLPSRA